MSPQFVMVSRNERHLNGPSRASSDPESQHGLNLMEMMMGIQWEGWMGDLLPGPGKGKVGALKNILLVLYFLFKPCAPSTGSVHVCLCRGQEAGELRGYSLTVKSCHLLQVSKPHLVLSSHSLDLF